MMSTALCHMVGIVTNTRIQRSAAFSMFHPPYVNPSSYKDHFAQASAPYHHQSYIKVLHYSPFDEYHLAVHLGMHFERNPAPDQWKAIGLCGCVLKLRGFITSDSETPTDPVLPPSRTP